VDKEKRGPVDRRVPLCDCFRGFICEFVDKETRGPVKGDKMCRLEEVAVMYMGSRVYICEFVGNVIKEEGNLCEVLFSLSTNSHVNPRTHTKTHESSHIT